MSGMEMFISFLCSAVIYLFICDIWRYRQIIKIRSQMRGKQDEKPQGDCEAVYWSTKEGQIMTRYGKCLYDKAELTRVIESANKVVADTQPILHEIRNQVACGVKGHEMEYNRVKSEMTCTEIQTRMGGEDYQRPFIFKCKNCGIEIAKTKSELTVKEKEALKLLKIL